MATKTTVAKKKRRHNPNRAMRSIWRAPDGNDYPMRDLDHGASILLSLINRDVDKALRCNGKRNPNACALSQGWMRTADVPVAQVGIDKAYLPIRENGKIVVLRCKVPQATREAINRFDKTGRIPAEGFWFVGIPPSERMDSQRSQQKQFRQRWGNIHDPRHKKHKSIYLRNASRRAQVFRKP